MKTYRKAALAAALLWSALTPALAADQRPNVLLIVADDLGYSDIGAFGGEIATPHLDSLARSGLRMSQFYASPFCSPTRAMLLSGADNHRVGFGSMAELMTAQQRSRPGYEGHLSERALTFPQLLKDAGYHTYMAGKWHLGMREEHAPSNRGFEQSYAMLMGGAGHFDQTGIITHDPDKAPFAYYRDNGKETKIPAEGFFSSEFFASRLISYIDADKADGKPFFGYLAFTAPHWPLQAPDEYIRKYEGTYDVGYDVIRERRLTRMKALGLVPKDMQPYVGNPVWPRWRELTPQQQRIESKRMAVYAAMVESMDAQIGRMLEYLRRSGKLDNTMVIFLSDNGADGNTVLDEGATREWARRHADNSVANTGRRGSFVEYGPGWAQVGSTPFNMYKAFMYEGGIAVPAIFSLPDTVMRGQVARTPAHVTDIAPTVLELAGVRPPGANYQGREVVPMEGRSMLGLLTGRQPLVHEEFLRGWEFNGRRALRKGDWKIVLANKPWGTGQWQLFNLARDRSELHDLAGKHPAKLRELVVEYERYARDSGVVDFDGLAERPGYSNGRKYYEDLNEGH